MEKYRIEFGELRIGDTARKNLIECCDSNWASMGPKVEEFEQEWNKLFKYGYSAAVSSGTDACINACLSLYNIDRGRGKAQEGDEVIVPALSFIATSNAVRAAGLRPVWVDVGWDLNIDVSKIRQAITPRTKAIMPVHTMGKMANMPTIAYLGMEHNLVVIEDACEAHGAKQAGRNVGSYGDMACFSFYIAHLICCGEGGMVSTNHEDVYNSLIATRTHGRPGGSLYFDHPYFGLNSKMNDLEASIGLEGVSRFWDTYKKRKYNLYYILSHLHRWYKENFYYNTEDYDEDICPHGFSLTFKDPELGKSGYNDLVSFLDSRKIKVKRNFGCIPTQHASYAHYGHKLGDFPVAEHIGNYGFHFGLHEHLTQNDLEYIIESLEDYVNL